MAVYRSEEKTKDGRQWYYVVYKKDIYGNKKQIKSKRFKTKNEALEEERIFLLRRDNPLHKEFPLVAKDYFETAKKQKKESTVLCYERDYKKHILPYFSKKYIDEITTKDVLNWKDELDKKDFKTSYKNKAYVIFRNIMNHGVVYYDLPTNVVAICGTFKNKQDQVIKDEEKLKYITYEEFNKLISVVDNNLYYALFHFLYYTGCRIGEVLALNWGDINFDTREIKINKTLSEKVYDGGYNITSTKNNLNRTIKLSQTLYDVMIKFLEERKQYTDYDSNWFVFGDYRPLPQTTIRRYKKKYFELAELKEITLHEFRHSHVSLLINEYIKTSKEKNMKVDTAKFFLMMSNRMGHTIEVMQKTYMHLFPSIQDEIVDLLDNL